MIICTLCPVCVCVSVCRPNEPNRMILLSLSLSLSSLLLLQSLSFSLPLSPSSPPGRPPFCTTLDKLISIDNKPFSLFLSLSLSLFQRLSTKIFLKTLLLVGFLPLLLPQLQRNHRRRHGRHRRRRSLSFNRFFMIFSIFSIFIHFLHLPSRPKFKKRFVHAPVTFIRFDALNCLG